MPGRPTILALLALGVATCAAGCTNWHSPNWDLDHLRDSRALEVERRLDERSSVAKDEFSHKTKDN